jgi:hypothetical protein
VIASSPAVQADETCRSRMGRGKLKMRW